MLFTVWYCIVGSPCTNLRSRWIQSKLQKSDTCIKKVNCVRPFTKNLYQFHFYLQIKESGAFASNWLVGNIVCRGRCQPVNRTHFKILENSISANGKKTGVTMLAEKPPWYWAQNTFVNYHFHPHLTLLLPNILIEIITRIVFMTMFLYFDRE